MAHQVHILLPPEQTRLILAGCTWAFHQLLNTVWLHVSLPYILSPHLQIPGTSLGRFAKFYPNLHLGIVIAEPRLIQVWQLRSQTFQLAAAPAKGTPMKIVVRQHVGSSIHFATQPSIQTLSLRQW